MKMTIFHKILKTEEETMQVAKELAAAIDEGVIIFLEGQLGAGKTTFTRGFLRGLGFQDKVKSPTYTIVEPYDVSGKKIFHFDFYRVKDSQELDEIGIQDYFSPTFICLVEWPEKGVSRLPTPDLICHIEFKQDGRDLKIEARSERGKKVVEKMVG